MSKKSFKSNIEPDINFISQERVDKVKESEKITVTDNTLGNKLKLAQNKKTPEGYKLNPLYIETKSKRLHLHI